MPPATLRQALAAIAVLAALSACGTAVKRIAPEELRDLSGSWNDTDSRLVSQEMVQGLRAWVDDYQLRHRRPPTLVLGNVRNLAQEPISVSAFVGDIERALVGSRRVTFVASGEERVDVREERKDQDYHAAGSTRKPMGRELGADYMLSGTIDAIVDRNDTTEVRYYQVDLALIDLADNSKAWRGQTKIKKALRRPPVSDAAITASRETGGVRFASHGGGGVTGMSSRIRYYECSQPVPPISCR
jgi:hypothetical protein